MAFDFPASPTNGQIVTFGSTNWQWNGTAWLMQSGSIGPTGPAGADGAPGATGPQGPVGPAGPVGEAPNDGQQYARQSLAWSPFTIPAPAPQVGLVDVGDTPPASPLDRQQFWKSDDGTMWLRYNDGTGAPQWVQTNAQPTPASVITEQFIDLSNAVQMDIPVPSWAKGVQLIGRGYMNTSAWIGLRVSFDGTTFPQGATDYSQYGPSPNTGSGGYATWGTASQTAIALSMQGDNQTVPHAFTAEMSLTRPNTANSVFECKTHARALDASAAIGARGWLGYGWPSVAISGANLAIKVLRIFHWLGTGMFGAGSYVQVKWLGDSNAIQTGTAIADAPSNGGEYVRVNGIWRLKSQTLDLNGKDQNGASALVPAGARAVKFAGSLMWLNSAAGMGASLRASLDGTNFLNGGADYTSSGDYINYAGAVAGQAPGNAAQTLIAVSGTVANVPVKFIGQQQVTKLATTTFQGHSYGASAQAATHYQGFFQWLMNSAAWAGATQIKAIQFGAHANTGTFSDSYVDLEWVY